MQIICDYVGQSLVTCLVFIVAVPLAGVVCIFCGQCINFSQTGSDGALLISGMKKADMVLCMMGLNLFYLLVNVLFIEIHRSSAPKSWSSSQDPLKVFAI